MWSFLKLIRIQNLLIIAFTQYMVRWCLLSPLFRLGGYHLQMSSFNFFLLSLSTVMIAAAGYSINDYFDVRIDKVNKPERMVIDKGVKRRVAIGAHTVINILAVLIGFYVSWAAGAWKLVIIHIICSGGLWLYSTSFKRQFFIGNVVIALFTAMVPMVVGIYELWAYHRGPEFSPSLRDIAWYSITGLSFFAFITTLLREIIKDIEDYEGDKEYGCKTLPIVLGIRTAQYIVVLLAVATMALLVYFQVTVFSQNMLSLYYSIVALQLPFLFLIWKTLKAKTRKQFRIAGNTAKFIMLMGVCYLFIIAFLS